MSTGTEERTCRALALRAAVQALALSTDELDLAPEPEEDVLELHSLSDHGGAPVWLGVARCSSGRWPVLSTHNELLTEAVQSLQLRRNQEPNFSSQDLYAAVSTVLDHDSCLEVAARLHGPDCKQWFQFWSIDVAPGPLRAALEKRGGVVRALGAGSNTTLRERAARATLALALSDEESIHSEEWTQLTNVTRWYSDPQGADNGPDPPKALEDIVRPFSEDPDKRQVAEQQVALERQVALDSVPPPPPPVVPPPNLTRQRQVGLQSLEAARLPPVPPPPPAVPTPPPPPPVVPPPPPGTKRKALKPQPPSHPPPPKVAKNLDSAEAGSDSDEKLTEWAPSVARRATAARMLITGGKGSFHGKGGKDAHGGKDARRWWQGLRRG